MDELLTAQQVSDRLQIHIMTVYKLIQKGTLQAMRVPGVGLRVKAEELEKLLDQTKRGSHASPEGTK